MTDVEGNPISYSRVPTSPPTTSSTTTMQLQNPYSEQGEYRRKQTVADRILNYVKRTFYMTLSLYALQHYFHFYQTIFTSPYIIHEWLKIGIAVTIALLGIKAYVEIYEGRVNKTTVDYSTFPQCTHAAMLLILLSSAAYHIALWPHYHYNTFLVLGILFFGVVLQFVLMTPSSIQNVVSFVLLAFFLQEYQ